MTELLIVKPGRWSCIDPDTRKPGEPVEAMTTDCQVNDEHDC
jgi:hypothetical protein